MTDNESLEMKIIRHAINFSNKNDVDYRIGKRQENSYSKIITLKMITPVESSRERLLFQHFIKIKKNKISENRTSCVEEASIDSRQLYISFIEYMNSKNISLQNTF